MSLSFDDFVSALLLQLTEDEHLGSVVYAAERLLLSGAQIQYTGRPFEVLADSFIGFIDQDPSANWGHSARYVLMKQQSGEVQSLPARLPPFGSGDDLHWRVVYQAPSVPDSAVEHLL